MHTLHQLHQTMFDLSLGDAPAPADALFRWGEHDRLGVVMTEPFGALGGSLAIQLAIASYFDFDGGARRDRPHYADIYLFHVGGRWGDFSLFDFWPSRREIFLPDDPHAVLAAINNHGITHLLVPDGDPIEVGYDFKEPEAAYERLQLCLAYAPGGEVAGADVRLACRDAGILENLHYTIWPAPLLDEPVRPEVKDDPLRLADHLRWRENVRRRLDEVAEADRATAEARARRLEAEGGCVESYRRVSAEWALGRLARQPI